MPGVEDLRARGEIGGRTVQIVETGDVECARYEPAPLPDGWVRIRTQESVISPGTETTLVGKDASNVYLHRRWNPELRLFVQGTPSLEDPVITLGYRAAGEVVESADPRVAVGRRVWGNWRHTEFVSMLADQALAQSMPDGLAWDDAVDIAQMGPICLNAALFGEGAQHGAPAVVYGAGPVGLITAQAVRAMGASIVHVVDRVRSRLDVASTLGLSPVDGSNVDVAAKLKTEHGAEGIPVVWECTGSVDALHDAIRAVRRRGSVVAAGFYQGDSAGLRLGDEFHHNGVRILSGQIGNPHPSTDRQGLQRMTLDMVTSGSITMGGLPRLRLPVEEIGAAYKAISRPADVLQVSHTFAH